MDNQQIIEYLSRHEFFEGFSDDVLKFLCDCSSNFAVKKEQTLFKQGEAADKFYIILKGRISIQIPALIGPPLEIQTLGKDQVLGWSWLIPPYKWNFQASAEENSELLQFEGALLLMHCEQEPKFGYMVVKKFAGLMSERLNEARRKMMEEWNPAGFG